MKNSDQRKLVFYFRKRLFIEKAWNGKRDWLLDKLVVFENSVNSNLQIGEKWTFYIFA